jgi:PAS domain S-box-containing protein
MRGYVRYRQYQKAGGTVSPENSVSPFLYVHFFCAIALMGSAAYLIASNPGGESNRTGFAALGFMSLWSLGTAFVENPYVNAATAQAWDMVSFVGCTSASVAAPFFFRAYTKYPGRVSSDIILWTAVVLAGLVEIGSLQQHLAVFPVMTQQWYGWAKTVGNPAPVLAGLLITTIMALSRTVFYLVSYIRRADSDAVRRSGRRTLWVLAVSYSLMIIVGIIIPLVTVEIPDMSDVLSLIWAVAFPYWVQHYRLVLSPGTAAGSIIAAMPDALFITDPHGNVVTANGAAERMLGVSAAELAGRPLARHFTDPGLTAGAAVVLKTGDNPDCRVRRRDGSECMVSITGSPARDLNGASSGMIFVARDISPRIAMELTLRLQSEELTRSNEELQAFAYVASHDLQEPLRKVSAYGERLAKRYGAVLEEQGRDYLDRMRSASQRMAGLIESLLNYSRLNSQPMAPETVDLGTVVSEVLSDLEIRIQSVGGRVDVGALPRIVADPVQMRQLMQNFIGNGLKYCRPGVPPVVRVSSRPVIGPDGSPNTEIAVADNGIGVEEQNLEKIFGVFQRLHTAAEYEGTGVGLSICRRIVIRHKGAIRVASVVGEGTSFIVTLPIGRG